MNVSQATSIIEKEMLPTAERDEILEFIKNNFKGLEKESDMDFFIQYLMFLDQKKQHPPSDNRL